MRRLLHNGVGRGVLAVALIAAVAAGGPLAAHAGDGPKPGGCQGKPCPKPGGSGGQASGPATDTTGGNAGPFADFER